MNSVYRRADAAMQALEKEDCPGLTAVDKVEFLLREYQKNKEERAAQAALSTRQRLLAALAETPWLTLQALADLAEEEGDGRQASAWRWIANHQRWPVCWQGNSWYWRFALDDEPARYSCSEFLPQAIPMNRYPHLEVAHGSVRYDSPARAVEALAEAMLLLDDAGTDWPIIPAWKFPGRGMNVMPLPSLPSSSSTSAIPPLGAAMHSAAQAEPMHVQQ